MAKRGVVQPDAKKNLAQIGQPKRATGTRSTEWYEGTAKTRIRATATTCDSCDGRGYVIGNGKAPAVPGQYTVRLDGAKTVHVPVCAPCKGLGFVLVRQREMAI
jgi:hypothetical protein